MCYIAFLFALISVASEPPKNSPLVGAWEGPLNLGKITVRIVFKIQGKPDGAFTGIFDSPDQGATGLVLNSASLTDGAVRFEYAAAKIVYVGKLSDDGQTIQGKWKQAGGTWPLDLKKVDKPTELRRPQHPKRPFPYFEEEVVVNNPAGWVRLGGTFTRPKQPGRYPAVVLVTGSGPQDRDETLFGHKLFLVIADHLTRQGIAVLRCDDRGVGKSTGRHAACTTADFVTDAAALVKYLRSRPDVDPQRVGIIGHSEGGIIAPAVAAEHPADVAFIILLAGTGVPGEDISKAQGVAMLKADGKSDLQIKIAGLAQGVALNKIKADAEAIEARRARGEEVRSGASPWNGYFLRYDPRPALRRVQCPVLALNGERDVQVSAKENLSAIAAALAEGGNKQVTIKALPELNHFFQHCKTGALSEYATIEETISPEVLTMMSDWIRRLNAPR